MKYHPSGAWYATEEKELDGIFSRDGYLQVVFDDDFSGIYTRDGRIRVHDVSDVEDPVGIYDPTGAWNVTVVDGTERVGVTARNGSRNIYLEA